MYLNAWFQLPRVNYKTTISFALIKWIKKFFQNIVHIWFSAAVFGLLSKLINLCFKSSFLGLFSCDASPEMTQFSTKFYSMFIVL